jgi:hypothetical protein
VANIEVLENLKTARKYRASNQVMNKILCIILVYTPEKNKIRLYPFSLVQKFQLYQLGDEEDPFTLDLEA